MTSYQSELGDIAAGLWDLGTLIRSGWIATGSVNFIFDHNAAILASSRGLTMSVFHRTESEFDLIATKGMVPQRRGHLPMGQGACRPSEMATNKE
jgi:hypothetical protein